jgi:hypothetical protein
MNLGCPFNRIKYGIKRIINGQNEAGGKLT